MSRIVSKKLVQRNSFFHMAAEMYDFVICFPYVRDQIINFAASQQYDIQRSTLCVQKSFSDKNRMVIRPLSVFEREDIRRFYLGLSTEDRHKRFCSTLFDATISAYVDRLSFTRDTFLGAFDEQAQLIGLAELACGPDESEMAFSVRPDKRGQKIGARLIERLLLCARVRGVRKVFVLFLADNEPMRRMASRAGLLVQTSNGEAYAARHLPTASAQDLARWFIEEGFAQGGYFATLGISYWGSFIARAAAAAGAASQHGRSAVSAEASPILA